MRMKTRSNSANSMLSGFWPSLGFLFGYLCIPLTIPWIMYQVFYKLQLKKQKSNLRGKVVVITGASSGLGEALAHSFYKIGCQVILAARREDELERVKSDLMQTYSTNTTLPPMVLKLDLSDLKSIQTKANYILDVFKHVDILINNGGISYRGNILTTDIDVDIKVMLINYFGSVALTKAFLPSMIERKNGHIVFVSSVQGKIAIPFRSSYSASKHAIQAFGDSLRAEVSQDNINVMVVSPGYIKTNLSMNAVTGDGDKYGIMDSTTASGYEPLAIAEMIVNAVANRNKDLVISTIVPQIGIILRTLCPTLYFWIMKQKARNS